MNMLGLLVVLAIVTMCDAQHVWVENTDHIGKRPVCDSNIDVTKGKNYRYQTLENCKQGCLDTPRCDTISRYVYTGKTDTSLWHCWFYACGPQTSTEWEPQTSWGNGADKAVTHFLLTRGRAPTKIINRTINETLYIDKVRWTDKTRWTNETRYIDKVRWTNETRYIDKVRWTNETRYIDKIIDNIRNETRYMNKTRWTNVTRHMNKIRWTNVTRHINKIRWTNATRYIDKVRWANATRYIDKVRYVEVLVNKTGYDDTLGPAALPAASADMSEPQVANSEKMPDECSEWDTRDYVLIIIIAVIAVAWCLKQTFEFFECRMPSKNAPATEEEIFPDAELPPMAWEVKVEDIVKD